VSGALLAALLLAGSPGFDLPEGHARYRVELSGAVVGLAELGVRCAGGQGCEVGWSTALRLPAEAGGGVRTRRLVTRLDGAGRIDEVLVDGLPADVRHAPRGSYPASAAELVLFRSPEGRCVTVFEEETGRSGPACLTAIAADGARRMTVLGVEELVRPGADDLPARVELPSQRAAYVRDGEAAVPPRVALSVRVAGPAAGEAARFCGRAPDPGAPPVSAELPPVRPDGRACQAQAAAYAAAARRHGLAARIAVGVAHDGQGFVWHAWAEVRGAAGWVAVDPAFGELPASAPRFTVARHGGDAASQRDAGRRILACWGQRVE
jgi:hypothetical protein